MALPTAPEIDHRPAATDLAGRPPGRLGGVALMLASGLANQAGASAGALAFPAIGPLGVVAIRQWVAAAALWATARPKPRAFTAAQWRPVLGLALVYAVMNLSLYTAIARVGLGLAVTLEFLGPLAVALSSPPVQDNDFLRLGHSLCGLLCAWIGCMVSRYVYATSDPPP